VQNAQAYSAGRAAIYIGLISTGTHELRLTTRPGKALPIGTPTVRNFATNEYAFYISDSWRSEGRASQSRAGLRYENDTPAVGN